MREEEGNKTENEGGRRLRNTEGIVCTVSILYTLVSASHDREKCEFSGMRWLGGC